MASIAEPQIIKKEFEEEDDDETSSSPDMENSMSEVEASCSSAAVPYPNFSATGPPISTDTRSPPDSVARFRSRKPYTITKQRENWTEDEHSKFLEALKLFNRDWKKIEDYVGTKSVKQIRSHAQKYFLKIQKSGQSELVPPPRPKRKASQPYPQKPKQVATQPSGNASWSSETSNPFIPNSAAFVSLMAETGMRIPMGGFIPHFPTPLRLAPSTLNSFPISTSVPTASAMSSAATAANGSPRGSGATSPNSFAYASTMTGQPSPHVVPTSGYDGPNFSKIYAFLGSLFDPNTTNHTETLNEMSQVDREIVQVLMNNLAVNLSNRQLRDHHAFLSEQYRSSLNKSKDKSESASSSSASSSSSSPASTTVNSPVTKTVPTNDISEPAPKSQKRDTELSSTGQTNAFLQRFSTLTNLSSKPIGTSSGTTEPGSPKFGTTDFLTQ